MDVRRQLAALQVEAVVEFRIVAEHALDEGPEQALFELAAGMRTPQRERGVDGQLALR